MGREGVRSKRRKEKPGTDGNKKVGAGESRRVVELEPPSFYLFFCFCTILGRFCATENRVVWD